MDILLFRVSRILFLLLMLGLGLCQSISINAQTMMVQTDVTQFSLSHQEDRVALVIDGTTPLVVDLMSSEILVELTDQAITTPINSVMDASFIMWSGDDERLLTVHDSEVAVWDASTGELLFELEPQLTMPVADDVEGNMTGNFSAAISSDGSRIAVGNWFDAIVSVYDVESGDITHQFVNENNLGPIGVIGIEFSPGDDLLSTWELSAVIRIWNLDTGEKQLDLPGETMAFNSDGRLIATGGGRFSSGVWIWDAYTGETIMETDAPLVAQQLSWSANDALVFGLFSGRRLISDGYIYVGEAIRGWNVATAQEDYTLGLAETFSIGLEPEAEETIIGVGAYHAEGYVLLWNQSNNDVYNRQFSPDDPLHDYDLLTEPIYAFALQSSGNVVYGGFDDEIIIWDTQADEQIARIPTDAQVVQIDYSESENKLIAILETDEMMVIPEDERLESPTNP